MTADITDTRLAEIEADARQGTVPLLHEIKAMARELRRYRAEGWVLVPRLLTDKMCWAWAKKLSPADAWSAMLAAAPTPPAGRGDAVGELVAAAKVLLGNFDSYRQSDLSHANAHGHLVHYAEWERHRSALSSINGEGSDAATEEGGR